MARLEVSDEDVKHVARGIGGLIDRQQSLTPTVQPMEFVAGAPDLLLEGQPQPNPSELRVGETLTMWKLTSAGFAALEAGKLTGDLVNWVTQTNFLYHQIKLNGEPQGFARSYIGEEDKPLLGVEVSPFAAKLGQALQKIDDPRAIENHERDDDFFAADPVVRLLTIPPCRIFALWLFVEPGQSRVMIIYATEPRPEDAPEPRKEFNERILTSEQFYKALNIYRPLLGVG